MKTFKFSLVALVATVLFAACSNEVAVETINGGGQEISFRLQGGTPEITTRSLATTTSTIEAFVVYGTDDVATSNIFNGVTVARQELGGFDYNPKRYYSVGATGAQFFAYSPVNSTLNLNISNLDAGTLFTDASFDYVVIAPDASGNIAQEDLLVAGKSISENPITTASSNVSLDFKHALSRIFVKATNSLTDNVVITGLKLKNLCSTGTLTGIPATASPWEWGWAWSNRDDSIDYTYILAPTGVAVKAGTGVSAAPNNVPALVTSMEQGMLVLPQVTTNNGDAILDAGEFALEVTYDVGNLTGEKKLIFLPNLYPFVEGNQYAITIAFSGTDLIEIDFTITVSPFIAVTDIP